MLAAAAIGFTSCNDSFMELLSGYFVNGADSVQ